MSSDMYNGLSITQTHRLQLNPQLLQSISVLCMNTTELGSYVERLYQENPCIERREPVVSDEMLKVLKEYRSRDYQGTAVGSGKRRQEPSIPDPVPRQMTKTKVLETSFHRVMLMII